MLKVLNLVEVDALVPPTDLISFIKLGMDENH